MGPAEFEADSSDACKECRATIDSIKDGINAINKTITAERSQRERAEKARTDFNFSHRRTHIVRSRVHLTSAMASTVVSARHYVSSSRFGSSLG